MPEAVPQDPKDAPAIGSNGVPLSVSSSIEELLAYPGTPPPAQPEPAATEPGPRDKAAIHEVSGELGESVASKQPAVLTDSEPAPVEATPEDEAPAEEPDEAPGQTQTDAAADEDVRIAELTSQKLGLLRTKGRQAQEIGDLRQQVEYLSQQVAAKQAQPYQAPANGQTAMSREELVTQLLDRPDEAIPAAMFQSPQFAQVVRELAQAAIMENVQAWQTQQVEDQAAVAPLVAKDVFTQRHGITTDFDTWLTTPEGQGVSDLVERDPARARLLSAYVEDSDVKGIANTLSKALEAHRLGKKAATARHSQNGETARVQASRPPSTPVKATTPPAPSTKAKSILEPWDEADLREFLQGAQPYQREG